MERVHKFIQVLVVFGFLQLMIIGVSAAPIGFGETVTGTIVTPAQTDSYTFTANAGDTIDARIHSSWGPLPVFQLFAQNGAFMNSSVYVDGSTTALTQILPSTGTFTLIEGDDNGAATGIAPRFCGCFSA